MRSRSSRWIFASEAPSERDLVSSQAPSSRASALTNEARYQDIVPNRRVVIASTMSLGDRRISASLVTFEFSPTEQGTDLIFTHQAAFFEGSDGPERREAGWRYLFEKLAKELTR